MMQTDDQMEFLKDPTYNVLQVNGQRIYKFNSKGVQKPPPKGCELFVGKLPRDLFEDSLVPIFTQIAPIYDLRLMVDFWGRNRGYCFVRYFTREAAETAVEELHDYEIRAGCRIGVYKSLDNTRLFIGGLPVDKTRMELWAALEKQVDDIKDIIMYPSYTDKTLNRGYAFIEFENHRAAAIARRRLPPGSLALWGSFIKVDWADPLPEPNAFVMAKVVTLYLRNIPVSVSNERFRNIVINSVSNPDLITRIHKTLDYAFIHCFNREAAVICKQELDDLVICGNVIEVNWARPKSFSKKFVKNITPAHFCLSLPSKSRWLVRKKHLNQLATSDTMSSEYDETTSQSLCDSPFLDLPEDNHNDKLWGEIDRPSCSYGFAGFGPLCDYSN